MRLDTLKGDCIPTQRGALRNSPGDSITRSPWSSVGISNPSNIAPSGGVKMTPTLSLGWKPLAVHLNVVPAVPQRLAGVVIMSGFAAGKSGQRLAGTEVAVAVGGGVVAVGCAVAVAVGTRVGGAECFLVFWKVPS